MRLLALPLPTSHTLTGPIVRTGKESCSVFYDCDLSKPVRWAAIHFAGVLSVTVRDMSTLGETEILGHDYMVEQDDTTALRECAGSRARFLVGNAYAIDLDKQNPHREFQLYFDDSAGIRIVARSYSIECPVPGPSE